MEVMTVKTRDALGKYWQIADALGVTFTYKPTGCDTCTFTMLREFAFAWDDIGLNSQLIIDNKAGDRAWYGRVESIAPTLQGDLAVIQVAAQGYWWSTYDLTVQGTVSGTTPEGILTSLIGATYLPQLSTVATGLATTGVTGISYQTGNTGTDNTRIGDAIAAVCSYGDSALKKVRAYVDATLGSDGKPRLNTVVVNTVTPSPRYILRRANINGIGLSRSLSLVRNRVIVRYKDSTSGAIANRPARNNTTSQGNLGVDYTGSAGKTNYIRSEILDMSGLQNGTTSAIADNSGDVKLNEVSRIRNIATGAITVTQDYVVYDTVETSEIPNWKVKAGYYLQIPDLFPRLSSVGSGSLAGDVMLETTFYISETKYDCDTGQLSLTPEVASDLRSLF